MKKQEPLKTLLENGVFTSVELCKRVNTADAHKNISRLRHSGIEIQDEWRKNKEGVRYKVYWISQHLTTKGTSNEKQSS